MNIIILLCLITTINTYQEQDFYTQAVVTNNRYQNDDVIWGRPKCLFCGDLVGAGPEQKPNLYPDITSTYFVANIKLEFGWKLIINGKYPHARYLSFTIANQLNDGQLGNGAYLRGDQIIPDNCSSNPFLSGVPRNITNRNYTITVVQGYPPAKIPPNTLYTATERTHLSIRIYLVDIGYDGSGGDSIPTVSLLTNNKIITGPLLLTILDARKLGDPNGYQLNEWKINLKQSDDPINAPVPRIPFAQVFWNTPYSVTGLFIWEHPEERVNRYPPDDSGGFASNPDTKYMVIPYSFGYNEVLVVTGVKPTHQYTRYGNQYIDANTQVQYFSVSTSAGPCSGEGWQTVYDEEIPEHYTIVVSWPWLRPINALRENNVTWLSPGDGEGHYIGARNWVGVLYFRFQNNNPNWKESPANIPMPSRTQPLQMDEVVMGKYYPRAKYMSKEEFEAIY